MIGFRACKRKIWQDKKFIRCKNKMPSDAKMCYECSIKTQEYWLNKRYYPHKLNPQVVLDINLC